MRVYTTDGDEHRYEYTDTEVKDGVLYVWRIRETENDHARDFILGAFPLTSVIRWTP